MSAEKQYRFETDDLIRRDPQTQELFYIGRRTLTRKRFGIMISLEYIEKVSGCFLSPSSYSSRM